MGLFGFGKKPSPNPYTREDMQRDINPSRINTEVYEGSYGSGLKPLQCAISSGDASIVGELIRNGADMYFKQSNGYLAIVNMLGGNNLSVLKELINQGFDINTCGELGTILHRAVQTHNPDLDFIRFLIKSGANVNSRGSQNNGRTPVQEAASDGNSNALQLLIDAGGKINVDYNGESPLFEAILGKSAGVALAFGGAYPNIGNIRVLVNAGAIINNRIWDLANRIDNEEVLNILKDPRAS